MVVCLCIQFLNIIERFYMCKRRSCAWFSWSFYYSLLNLFLLQILVSHLRGVLPNWQIFPYSLLLSTIIILLTSHFRATIGFRSSILSRMTGGLFEEKKAFSHFHFCVLPHTYRLCSPRFSNISSSSLPIENLLIRSIDHAGDNDAELNNLRMDPRSHTFPISIFL